MSLNFRSEASDSSEAKTSRSSQQTAWEFRWIFVACVVLVFGMVGAGLQALGSGAEVLRTQS